MQKFQIIMFWGHNYNSSDNFYKINKGFIWLFLFPSVVFLMDSLRIANGKLKVRP